MNLETEFFQKEIEIEIRRQCQELQKRYEEIKNIDMLSLYLHEETQKVFKKAFMFMISQSSDEILLNSKELKENKEQLKEKEEANQKILSKILDLKAFLDSFS